MSCGIRNNGGKLTKCAGLAHKNDIATLITHVLGIYNGQTKGQQRHPSSIVPSFIARNIARLTFPEGTWNVSEQLLPNHHCRKHPHAQQRLIERPGVWALHLVNGDGPLRCRGCWTTLQNGTCSNESRIDVNCAACPESITNESNQRPKPSKIRPVHHEHSIGEKQIVQVSLQRCERCASKVLSWSVAKKKEIITLCAGENFCLVDVHP